MKASCRPISDAETEEFLSLLCGVFNLDFNRAKSVFYSEPFFDLTRKWALFRDGEMVSILTTTPLTFGSLTSIGIAGVATRPQDRCQGLAQQLLEAVLEDAAARGEHGALLFAHEETVYRRVGFVHIDDVIRGEVSATGDEGGEPLEFEAVQDLYNAWSRAKPGRLERDDRRWRYWNWMLRSCESTGAGYICHEPGIVREAVGLENLESWPVPSGTEWVGLASLTKAIGVPIRSASRELLLMATGFTEPPAMFMTDQF